MSVVIRFLANRKERWFSWTVRWAERSLGFAACQEALRAAPLRVAGVTLAVGVLSNLLFTRILRGPLADGEMIPRALLLLVAAALWSNSSPWTQIKQGSRLIYFLTR